MRQMRRQIGRQMSQTSNMCPRSDALLVVF